MDERRRTRVKYIKYESAIVISKILSATIEFLEYSIIPQPRPTARLVPTRDSNTASKINGSLIYVEEAPTNLIILISFFLE